MESWRVPILLWEFRNPEVIKPGEGGFWKGSPLDCFREMVPTRTIEDLSPRTQEEGVILSRGNLDDWRLEWKLLELGGLRWKSVGASLST